MEMKKETKKKKKGRKLKQLQQRYYCFFFALLFLLWLFCILQIVGYFELSKVSKFYLLFAKRRELVNNLSGTDKKRKSMKMKKNFNKLLENNIEKVNKAKFK